MATETTTAQVEGTAPQITETKSKVGSDDPFAGQKGDVVNPFSTNGAKTGDLPVGSPPKNDRRLSSDEWDASKTPPSRFQQRKGSVYATPNSRDGHVDKNYDRDAAYHQKLKEKGWAAKRRGSKGSET